MIPTRLLLASVVLAAPSFCSGSTAAPRVENTIQVLGRAVSFLVPPMTGSVTMAIVYERGDATSTAEAQAIERALGSRLKVGSVTLTPRMVPSTSLGNLHGARVAFVTRGTNYAQVTAAAARLSILTVSSDRRCATSGHCIMAISSNGKVRILVSRAAARTADLTFSTSFLMLITEV